MVAVGFGAYAVISTALLGFVCNNAVQTRQQFYPAAIYLTTSKLHVAVLGNMAILLVLTLGRTIKRIFLGTLTRHEVEELWNNSKHAIVDTAMALTIFHEELNIKVLVLFVSLLFVKIFHWLAALRVENVSRAANMTMFTHIRLVSLMALLAIVDILFIAAMTMLLLSPEVVTSIPHYMAHQPYAGRGVFILFVFEFTILIVANFGTFAKYLLTLNDARLNGQWHNKSVWMFYLDFTTELIRLFLYLIFGLIVFMQFSLPLHLFRELYMTFHSLRQRVVRFINYRRLTKNMNEWLPDATADELARGDRTCIVCREEMDTAKKLPCNHKFHFHCLRTWLEGDHRCPTCRAALPTAPPNGHTPAAAAAAVVAANGDAAAAAVAAAAMQLPALPPHLRAIQDAARAARESKQSSSDTTAPSSPIPSLSSSSSNGNSNGMMEAQMALSLAHQRDMMLSWWTQQQALATVAAATSATTTATSASMSPATSDTSAAAGAATIPSDAHLLLSASVAASASITPTMIDALSPAIALSVCQQQLAMMHQHITLLDGQLTAMRASYHQQLMIHQLLQQQIHSDATIAAMTAAAAATTSTSSSTAGVSITLPAAASTIAPLNEDSKEAVVASV